jgi:hypothetical protein
VFVGVESTLNCSTKGGLGFLENPTTRIVLFNFSIIGNLRKYDPGNFPVHKPVTRSESRLRNINTARRLYNPPVVKFKI